MPSLPSSRQADRNLLLGILALQMEFITRDALIAAMNSWVLDKKKTLGEVLIAQGALSSARLKLLDGLVAEHLAAHGDDPERSLAAMPGVAGLRPELEAIADPEVQASLASLNPTPSFDCTPPPPPTWKTGPSSPRPTDPDATTDRPAAGPGCRFRILRPHARGGLGEVFVAEDVELHREVALKEIQEKHADDAASRSRFVVEAEVTAGLEHPGVVPVYGMGTHPDGRPYFAMRFIKGDTLKKAIDEFYNAENLTPSEHRLQLRQLLGRFLDLCNAIAYAHSRGVIHRDIKPSNVMLGKFGETLVVDWGLAKSVGRADVVPAADDEATLRPTSGSSHIETRYGVAIGTPSYMSPEQAAGRVDHIGPGSDVYSLGATLYTIITGQPPFQGVDAGDILQQVRAGKWRPARAVNPRAPRGLEAVCRKAMALKPADRYESVLALAADVEHWLADEPVSAHREPLLARAARWGRRHRTLVTTGVVLLLTTVVSLTAGLVLLGREQAQTEARRQEAVKAQQLADEKARQAIDSLYYRNVALADREWRDQNLSRAGELLGECPAERRGWEWHYLNRRCFAYRQKLRHAGPVQCVAFTPDGKRLLTAALGLKGLAEVKLWDVETGKPIRAIEGQPGPAWAVLSPDGLRAACLAGQPEKGLADMKVISTDTGAELFTVSVPLNAPAPVFTPDGKLILVDSDPLVKPGRGDAGLLAFAAETGKPAPGLRGARLPIAFAKDGKTAASASRDNPLAVLVWDLVNQTVLHTLRGHANDVTDLAFADESQLISASRTSPEHAGEVFLWNTKDGTELGQVAGAEGPIAVPQKGPVFRFTACSSTRRGAVLNCSVTTRTVMQTFTGHAHEVTGFGFSHTGKRLVSVDGEASEAGVARIWDVSNGQEVVVFRGHTGGITATALSPDDGLLATAGQDGMALLWDTKVPPDAVVIGPFNQGISALVFSPDGKYAAFNDWRDSFDNQRRLAIAQEGAKDLQDLDPGWKYLYGVLYVYDRTANKYALRIDETDDTRIGINRLAFSPDGSRLAGASPISRSVAVWDTTNGKRLLRFRPGGERVETLRFSPDGTRLLVGSVVNPVRRPEAALRSLVEVWDVATGQLLLTFGDGLAGPAAAFSRDGQQLIAPVRAPVGVVLGRWNVSNGSVVSTIPLDNLPTAAAEMLLSADGTVIAGRDGDRTIRVWGTANGKARCQMTRGSVQMGLSPDGSRLVFREANGDVVVVDAGEGRDLLTLNQGSISVNRAEFTVGAAPPVFDDGGALLGLPGEKGLVIVDGAPMPEDARLPNPEGIARDLKAFADRQARDLETRLARDPVLRRRINELAYLRALATRERQARLRPQEVAAQTGFADGLYKLAVFYFRSGQNAKGTETLEQCLGIIEKEVASHPGEYGPQDTLAFILGLPPFVFGKTNRFDEEYQGRLERAVAIREKLFQTHPKESGNRGRLMNTYHILAECLRNREKPEEAEKAFAKAAAMRDELTRSSKESDRGQDLSNLGASWRMSGNWLVERKQFAEAEAAYEKAITICEQALRSPDFEVMNLGNLGDTHTSLGWLYEAKLDKIDLAEKHYRKAIDRYTQQTRRTPYSGAAQASLAKAHTRLAVVLKRGKRLPDAAQAYEESLKVLSALVLTSEDAPEYQAQLASTANDTANVYYDLNNLPRAETLYKQALGIWQRLRQDPATAAEAYEGLAIVCRNLGNRCAHKDPRNPPEAQKFYEAALAAREELVRRFPETAKYRDDLATLQEELVKFYEAQRQPDRAEAAYRRALERTEELLRKDPNNAGLHRALGEAQYRFSNFCRETTPPRLEEAEKAIEEAIRIRAVLAEDVGGDSLLVDLASAWNSKGIIHREKKEVAKAESAYQRSAAMWEELAEGTPSKPYYRSNAGITWNNLGILFENEGKDKGKAKIAYLKAMEFRAGVVRDEPENETYRTNLRATCDSLAKLHDDFREAEAAGRVRPRIVEAYRSIVKEHPTFGELKRDLAQRLNEAGGHYSQNNAADRAEALYREALGIYEALAREDPKDGTLELRIAEEDLFLGNLYLFCSPRRPEKGLAHYQAAQQRIQKLYLSTPSATYAWSMIEVKLRLALYASRWQDLQAADNAFREAMAQAEHAVRTNPGDAGLLAKRAEAMTLVAQHDIQHGQLEVALQWARRARPELEALVARDPKNAGLREQLMNAWNMECMSLTFLNRLDEAGKAWAAMKEATVDDYWRDNTELARLGVLARAGEYQRAVEEGIAVVEKYPNRPELVYNCACLYADAAGAARVDPKLNDAERMKKADEYAAKAVALLRELQQTKWVRDPGKPEHWKIDKDLDPLRDRADFKQLLKELEESFP